jgi:AcrR family transcriptional regulator
MANRRNDEKREKILKAAYGLIVDYGYANVSMQGIAEASGISKSLLQKYYPQKNFIFQCLMKDIHITTFEFVSLTFPDLPGIYYKLAALSRLFFQSILAQRAFNLNIIVMMTDNELKDLWTILIRDWLKEMNDDELKNLSAKDIEAALRFVIAGGIELAVHSRELGLDGYGISQLMSFAFFHFLNIDKKQIAEIISWSKVTVNDALVDNFGEYCKRSVPWYR